jgi:hypothetical protein
MVTVPPFRHYEGGGPAVVTRPIRPPESWGRLWASTEIRVTSGHHSDVLLGIRSAIMSSRGYPGQTAEAPDQGPPPA